MSKKMTAIFVISIIAFVLSTVLAVVCNQPLFIIPVFVTGAAVVGIGLKWKWNNK